jgi:hypothetical protein
VGSSTVGENGPWLRKVPVADYTVQNLFYEISVVLTATQFQLLDEKLWGGPFIVLSGCFLGFRKNYATAVVVKLCLCNYNVLQDEKTARKQT